MIKTLMIGLMGTLGFVSTTNAAIIHNESIEGDLSNDNLAPTIVQLMGNGSNIVEGTTLPKLEPSDPVPQDPDFWSFTIQNGQALTGIILESYSNADDVGLSQSFFAVSKDFGISSITDDSDLLGSALIGVENGTQQGDNLLPALGQAVPGGEGFQGRLGPGTYTFWTQETVGDTSYAFNFQISSVPEPNMVLGLFALSSISMFVGRQKS